MLGRFSARAVLSRYRQHVCLCGRRRRVRVNAMLRQDDRGVAQGNHIAQKTSAACPANPTALCTNTPL
eukprot:782596-Pyramimonas_sp.AAC.1